MIKHMYKIVLIKNKNAQNKTTNQTKIPIYTWVQVPRGTLGYTALSCMLSAYGIPTLHVMSQNQHYCLILNSQIY